MKLLLACAAALLLASSAAGQGNSSSSGQCNAQGVRVFCGWNGVPQDQCEGQYGCCYQPAATSIGNGGATEALPLCFKYNTGTSAYSFAAGGSNSSGANSGSLSLQTGTQSELGADISNLQLSVVNVSPSILRVTIGAPGRYTIPQNSLFQNVDVQTGSGNNLYNYASKPSPFGFTVNRAGSTAPATFDTTGQRLMFKDQYLELTTAIQPSSRFFGLGERVPSTGMELLKNGLPLTLWNRDQPAADPDVNNYGSHPSYMEIRSDGTANGMIMMNANGMDVTLTNSTMRFSMQGGVLDMYFLMGPSPFDVTNQLTQIIGRPALPPYWALGFMNSKYGYDSAEYYTYVIDQYAQANIPLETFVADSQYMANSKIWTLGQNFSQSDVAAIINRLHSNGQRFVPIVEPVVHIQPGYATYDTGLAQNVFVKDVTGSPYTGQLWPGSVHWPDFMSPAAIQWWQGQMSSFHNMVNYDGLWLDMDEVSNYCTGDVCQNPGPSVGEQNQFICQLSCSSGPSTATSGSNTGNATVPPSSYFTPPFAINNGNSQLPVSTKTLPVTASHYDGTLEYNVHNLYGLYFTKAVYEGLVQIRQKRPFILTRSTFLGSGAYAAHWTGDTMSAWEDMQWSIPSVLNQGLAGIPFAGADICGFENYATESLCARWTAIGAWYPFCRDHHADGFQELYRWPSVAQIARQQLGWRMRAMPYLYSAFFDSSQFGCPVMRPLFYAFPADQAIYGQTGPINQQFMIGDGLLINPVTQTNSTAVSVYFPSAKWYSLYDYSIVDASAGSISRNYQVGLTDNAPIYIMGGVVMPLGQGGMVTDAARNSSLTFVVALPSTNSSSGLPLVCGNGCPQPTMSNVVVACGHMYLDQGEQLAVGSNRDNYLSFFAQQSKTTGGGGTLDVTWAGNPAGSGACTGDVEWPDVMRIDVLGLSTVDTTSVSVVGLSGTGVTNQAAGQPLPSGSVTFKGGVLSLEGLDLQLACPEGFRVSWGSITTNPTATAGK